jgi:hypothetical protein
MKLILQSSRSIDYNRTTSTRLHKFRTKYGSQSRDSYK